MQACASMMNVSIFYVKEVIFSTIIILKLSRLFNL